MAKQLFSVSMLHIFLCPHLHRQNGVAWTKNCGLHYHFLDDSIWIIKTLLTPLSTTATHPFWNSPGQRGKIPLTFVVVIFFFLWLLGKFAVYDYTLDLGLYYCTCNIHHLQRLELHRTAQPPHSLSVIIGDIFASAHLQCGFQFTFFLK